MKVQAQHIQAGDIVGSGEEVSSVTVNSIYWPSNKVCVALFKPNPMEANQYILRRVLWGKYTQINVERKTKCEYGKSDTATCFNPNCARPV